MIVSLIVWPIFGVVALALNIFFGSIAQAKNIKEECQSGMFWNSMINIWIIADVIICMLLMPSLVFKFYMDKKL